MPVENKSTNILEYINAQEGYSGKVVAFNSWNVFPFILNEIRSKFPVNSGYEMLDEIEDTTNKLINEVQQKVVKQTHTRYNLLTYASAKEYIEHNHPKVTFIVLAKPMNLHTRTGTIFIFKRLTRMIILLQTFGIMCKRILFIKTTQH